MGAARAALDHTPACRRSRSRHGAGASTGLGQPPSAAIVVGTPSADAVRFQEIQAHAARTHDGEGARAIACIQTDYYAWTKDQAAKLRALAAARVNSTLDLENLAEEVESLGRSDLNTVRSQVRRIIEHLLELEFSPSTPPRADWRHSVAQARDEVEDHITASMYPDVAADLAKLFGRARRDAAWGCAGMVSTRSRERCRQCARTASTRSSATTGIRGTSTASSTLSRTTPQPDVAPAGAGASGRSIRLRPKGRPKRAVPSGDQGLRVGRLSTRAARRSPRGRPDVFSDTLGRDRVREPASCPVV